MKYFEETFEVKWFGQTSEQIMGHIAERVKTWLAGLDIGLTLVEEKRKTGSGGYVNVFYSYPDVKHLIRVSFYNYGNSIYYGFKETGNTDDIETTYGYDFSNGRITRYKLYVIAGEGGIILSCRIPQIYGDYQYSFVSLKVVDEAGKEYGIVGSSKLGRYAYADENLEKHEQIAFFNVYGMDFSELTWDGYCFLLPLFLSESGAGSGVCSSYSDKKFLMLKEMKLVLGKRFGVGRMYVIGKQKYYCIHSQGSEYVNYVVPIDN